MDIYLYVYACLHVSSLPLKGKGKRLTLPLLLVRNPVAEGETKLWSSYMQVSSRKINSFSFLTFSNWENPWVSSIRPFSFFFFLVFDRHVKWGRRVIKCLCSTSNLNSSFPSLIHKLPFYVCGFILSSRSRPLNKFPHAQSITLESLPELFTFN